MSFGELSTSYGHGRSLILLTGAKLTFFPLPSTKSILHLSTGSNLAEDLHGKPLFSVCYLFKRDFEHVKNR